MKIGLIVFDMDGVIFDTEPVYYRAWHEAAQAFGYPMSDAIYKRVVGRNSECIIKELKEVWGEEVPVQQINEEKRARALKMIAEEGLKTKKGVYRLMEVLKKKEIKKVLATSSERKKTEGFLRQTHLDEVFDGVICGDDVKESKPNPEIFLKAVQLVKGNLQEAVVIEDSKFGLEAAKRAGMRSIWIPDLMRDEEMKALADWVLPSLDEVITLLDQ